MTTGLPMSALGRYRVMAYVVGIGLLVLVGVAMPLKYFFASPGLIAIVGPVHGFLYVVYLVVAFNLGVTLQWRLPRILLLALAGAVPFLSFVVEHRVTREVVSRSGDDDLTELSTG